ncbi:MAG: GGDEF domain-containing protein [Deltaproteobacteria bacterium]|nr:GGDEF domain-containing protein [Deltaproteobacteria bacterium]
MKVRIQKLYNTITTAFQLLYRGARGLDHRILSRSIIKISQQQDIDSIIFQAARCLNDILDYRFFAFAVYDQEYNGGVDIWTDHKIDNLPLINRIKNDFAPFDTSWNIRYFPDVKTPRPTETIANDDILKINVLDNGTRAYMYLLPRRMMLPYHSELLDIIVKIIATAVTNFLNMKKLENAALIDPLTHCYNRRAMDGYLERDLANANRYGSDIALIMLDIDHFKTVNDSYGHKAGDVVLRAVSKCVLSAIRKGDYLARYGGEEFVLVLPETKFSKAIELAERLRVIIENLKINIGNQSINVTASFGVTSGKQGADKDKLIGKADEMLYKAKRSGRNRIKPDLRLFSTHSGQHFHPGKAKNPLSHS